MSWNKSQGNNQPDVLKKRHRGSSCVIGAIFVLVCAIPVVLIYNDEPEKLSDAVSKKVKRIAEKTPFPTSKTETTGVVRKLSTAKRPTINMKSLTPEQREQIREEKLQNATLNLEPSSNQVFTTATEQIMSWIFNTEPGSLPPPLPPIPDIEYLHLTEILISNNSIREYDNEFTAKQKECVAEIKKELKNYIKKGGSPDEFFEYYHGQLAQAYQERETVRKSVLQVMREDPDIAVDYLQKVNERLMAKGIKEIKFHPKQFEHFGIEK